MLSGSCEQGVTVRNRDPFSLGTMPIPKEIERKFALLPNVIETRFYGLPVAHITQAYLAFDGTEVRIRLSDCYAPKVTLKRGSGVVRDEVEFVVDADTAASLLELAEPYVIRKRRYDTPDGWEVDFFQDGASEPIAEIELDECFYSPPRGDAQKYGIDLRRELTDVPAFLNRNIALRVGATADAKAGYHLRHIPKGILGEVSKIREELEELEDATIQQVKVLQLVELSDLVGAAVHLGEKLGVTVDDLLAMAKVTRRAFANGAR